MPPALQNPIILWLLLTAALAGLVFAFMRPELRWKAILYGSFLLACGVAIWPPYDRGEQQGKIHLGLDLRGGIHLVLQVVVEDALNATTDDAVNTTRDQATRKGIQVASVQRTSATAFTVEGIEPARVKDMRDLLRDFFRIGWEVKDAGENKLTVQMTDVFQRQLKEQTVQEAIRTLERRVNALGVAEPVIAATGSRNDQILVQLPGVTDVEAAKRIIKTTAQLSLKLVENSAATQDTLLQGVGGKVPDNMELLSGPSDTPGQPTFYLRPQGVADHGPRPQERPRRRRRVEPPADQLRAERDRDRPLLARHAEEHRPPARDRARQHRVLGAGDPEQARLRQPDHRPLLDPGGRRAREDPQGGRPAGDAALPAAADGGRLARPRLDPRRRDGGRRPAWPSS